MADHGQLLTDDGRLEESHPGVSESSVPPATVQRPPRASGRRPRWQWTVAIVLVVALIAGGVTWWFVAHRKTATTTAAATTTTTPVAASLNTITDSISASGTVTPAVQQAVSFAASGKVTAIKVAAGDTVKQGQVLGTIDTVNLKAALASSQATLASDQAKVSSDKQSIVAASSAFSSSVSSYSSASSSSSSVAATATTTATSTPSAPTQNTPSQLAAQTQLSADEAAVVTAQSQVTAAQQALADASLTAPIAGIVTVVNVDVGDQVTGTTTSSSTSSGTKAATGTGSGSGSGSGSGTGSGTTTSSSSSGAFEIVGTSSWQASVTVDDSQIGLIKNGIQAQLVVGSSTAALFGRVTSVGLVSTSTGSTASYPVTVTITGAPTGLHDGASATVTLIYKQLADVLTVPTLAIHEENSQKVVYQSVNGKQVSVPVTTGETSGLLTQITAGLAEGDEVLVTTTTRAGGSGAAARTGARATGTRTGGFGGYGTGGAGGGFDGNAGGNDGGNVGGGGAGAGAAPGGG